MSERTERIFQRNRADARENGYATICVECGTAQDEDDAEHESWCGVTAQAAADFNAFADRIAGAHGRDLANAILGERS